MLGRTHDHDYCMTYLRKKESRARMPRHFMSVWLYPVAIPFLLFRWLLHQFMSKERNIRNSREVQYRKVMTLVPGNVYQLLDDYKRLDLGSCSQPHIGMKAFSQSRIQLVPNCLTDAAAFVSLALYIDLYNCSCVILIWKVLRSHHYFCTILP